MGTRARIAMQLPDGAFRSIYTHWDGYPSHHGAILQQHYTDPGKVEQLIALGDLSVLGEEIGGKHAFDTQVDGVCTAYGRDRGEKDIEPQDSSDLAELKALTQECGGEYLYVFIDGVWHVAKGGMSMFGMPASDKPKSLHPVSEVLALEVN